MTVERIEENNMEEMMQNIDSSIKKFRDGDIAKGKVISINENEAIVNIGYMSDCIIPKNEVSSDREFNINDILNVDDEINVYIVKLNDGEGNVLGSKKRADSIVVWDELEEYMENSKQIQITVNEAVKGGVVAFIKGIRAFIPASQLSVSYVKDLNEFVGKELEVKVIELDKEKRRVVLSRRVIEQAQLEVKREEIWKTLKVGEKVPGTVSRLTNFGAFVDLGGIDGLVHVSELSWNRVKEPSQVVSVGDKVEVYILDLNREKGRISLSLKDAAEDPWKKQIKEQNIGSIVDGTVTKLMKFGAFVDIGNGIEGLVHISQLSDEHVNSPSEVVSIGDKVKVKILDINEENKRIGLSIKEAKEKEVEDYSQFVDTEEESGFSIGDAIGDKLKNFKLK